MKRKNLFFFALGGIGINLLNLIVGSYLCSALLIEGFSEAALPFHTYAQTNLVIISAWGAVVLIAKIIDGIIDIPVGLFIDWYKKRTANISLLLSISTVLTVLAFIALLIIPKGSLLGNTIYYGIMLSLFYIFYTATMECYYASFNDVATTSDELHFLSNSKTIFDLIYFILGFVVVAGLLSFLNIRVIAFIALPSTLTMLIPILVIRKLLTTADKKYSTFESFRTSYRVVSRDTFYKYWLLVFGIITFGLQLFIGGINEYFSAVNLNMMLTMASIILPIPIIFKITQKYVKLNGFIFTLKWTLALAILGMFGIYCASMISSPFNILICILSGLACSWGVGMIFSAGYIIPAQLAARQNKLYNCSFTASYFAVQGLVSAVATGLSSGLILMYLRQCGHLKIIPFIVIISFILAIILLFNRHATVLNYIGERDE